MVHDESGALLIAATYVFFSGDTSLCLFSVLYLTLPSPPYIFSTFLFLISTCSGISRDTVANVLTWAFYYLAKDSSLKQKLRTALEPIYQQEQSDSINSSLSGVKLLNAIINETMRLRGSIPVGGSRLTPSEGIRVGDVWIPGDVTIFTPGHVMHRSKAPPTLSPSPAREGI